MERARAGGAGIEVSTQAGDELDIEPQPIRPSPPTPEELTNKSKTQFVTMYNQILASLNTASLSFEKAYLL